ncbi:MAG: tRNA epoxyqueuosine(34) reductase QueG [Gammaproteobacteria bacterium]|nr:MAG: tRNA epoxyqueuosine(34) reductase QueG [Gammaproteobacteria bacterium]
MTLSTAEFADLASRIRIWAGEFGFQQVGIAAPDLATAGARLQEWLNRGYHADMEWLRSRAALSTSPATTVPGTIRVISVRMDYQREEAWPAAQLATEADRAWITRYALGRDYHRIMRPRLQRLATRISGAIGPFGYRAFVDSGPVMEKPLAQQAGLGWIGKHTNLVNSKAGSWFLLGEILTDLALPVDTPADDHCGSCTACLAACPTGAIVAPYVLDARRCISYLTIENKGPIPEALRPALGNRVFGCDDCQLACPWNKFARFSAEDDFAPRHGLDHPSLAELFLWSETTWLERTAGSAIRRAGYHGWLRNLAVALGNAPTTPQVLAALQAHRDHPSPLVREHVRWALRRHGRE